MRMIILNHDKKELEKIKLSNDIIISWLVLLSMIVGGIYAYIQYINAKKDKKIDESLKFIQKFYEPPVSQYFDNISLMWLANKKDFWTKMEAGKPSTKVTLTEQKIINEVFDNETLRIIDKSNMRNDLLRMTNFLNMVSICANNGICDPQTIYSFFGKYMCDFIILHRSLINEMRITYSDNNTAREIDKFLTEYAKNI
ncbi:MAG: hypothetical protein HQK96_21630 [Nitrospirae bacterium]|nr:hypothetical protein [Nitrospirota bacterium]